MYMKLKAIIANTSMIHIGMTPVDMNAPKIAIIIATDKKTFPTKSKAIKPNPIEMEIVVIVYKTQASTPKLSPASL